ncbi:hypothetical protein ACFL0Q_00235 [Thermodesulfobacteriota bacterium]
MEDSPVPPSAVPAPEGNFTPEILGKGQGFSWRATEGYKPFGPIGLQQALTVHLNGSVKW